MKLLPSKRRQYEVHDISEGRFPDITTRLQTRVREMEQRNSRMQHCPVFPRTPTHTELYSRNTATTTMISREFGIQSTDFLFSSNTKDFWNWQSPS